MLLKTSIALFSPIIMIGMVALITALLWFGCSLLLFLWDMLNIDYSASLDYSRANKELPPLNMDPKKMTPPFKVFREKG